MVLDERDFTKIDEFNRPYWAKLVTFLGNLFIYLSRKQNRFQIVKLI